MNLDQLKTGIDHFKQNGQIFEAAHFLLKSFDLDHENFAGFGFRPELEPNKMLLTAEGVLGEKQMVMIPRNIFDFDLSLVANMVAHEMLHVRQKAPENLVEDKNEREFKLIPKCFFTKIFHLFPMFRISTKNSLAKKLWNILKEWERILICKRNMSPRN